MKIKFLIVLLLLCALLLCPQRTMADELLIPPKPLTPQEYIKVYAKEYEVSEKLLLSVAYCESKYNEKAIGDNGKAYGIFQFHRQSFDRFKKELGEDLDYSSAKDQAKLAAFAFSKGYQHHWTCFEKVVQ